MARNLRYISTFDSLRAIAVLMVLVTHSGILLHLPISQELLSTTWIIRWGHLGVNLFFVLSGFLITRILIADRGRKGAYKDFLIRRALRIFPIYYLVILVLYFVEPGSYLGWAMIYGTNYSDSFVQELHPMAHAWSLSVEEHFYLIWSPIVLLLPLWLSRLSAWIVFPIVSIVSVLITIKLFPEQAQALIYRGTNYQIVALAMGAIIAYHERWLTTHRKNCFFASGVLFVLSLIVGSILVYGLDVSMIIARLYSYSLLSSSLVCFFLGIDLSPARSWCRRLLTTRSFGYLGKISYGIYLYHFPIFLIDRFDLFPPKQTSSLGIILLSILLTLVLASISYRWIEYPLLKLKSRFA